MEGRFLIKSEIVTILSHSITKETQDEQVLVCIVPVLVPVWLKLSQNIPKHLPNFSVHFDH